MNPTSIRKAKARSASEATRLEDIPNVGPAIAAYFRSVEIHTPDDVRQMDPWTTYDRLRAPMGKRHDPCMLDVLLAARDFMRGGPAQPWWNFKAERNRLLLSRMK